MALRNARFDALFIIPLHFNVKLRDILGEMLLYGNYENYQRAL